MTTTKEFSCSWRLMIAYRLFAPPPVQEVAPLRATLPWDCAGLALKFCEYWPLYSSFFIGAGALENDSSSLFCFWIDEWFTLPFFYLDSFPVFAFLFLNSILSLSSSSSTYWTLTINLEMSMSSINIAALPSLVESQPKPATNKLILLFISLTISGSWQDSWVNFQLIFMST